MPSLRPDQVLCLLIATAICLTLPAPVRETFTVQTLAAPPIYESQQEIPFPKENSAPTPDISANGVIIFEPYSGSILYSKNADQSIPLASLTKLMTALVALETFQLDQELTVQTENTIEGNRMKLVSGEKILVRDLLAGLLIFSGNDAAMTLANNDPNGYSNFLEKMNSTARKLGMNQTSFENPTGLDSENQFSSAHDIAILTKEILLQPEIARILGEQMREVKSTDGQFTHTLYTTNELLGKIAGLTLGKTGSTLLAGECLMTVVERNEKKLVTVVMGSQARFDDTQVLIDWAYENFTWTTPDLLEYNKEDII